MALGVALPAGHRGDEQQQAGGHDETEGDETRPAVELPLAPEEKREAEDEQEVADHAPRERAPDDLGQALGDREEGDDQLGRVAEARVEEAADPGPGVMGCVLGRLADEPRERDEGRGGEDEDEDLAAARTMDGERDRRDDERAPEDAAGHRAVSLPERPEPDAREPPRVYHAAAICQVLRWTTRSLKIGS